ncbi:SAP domain-containing protein, partial [Candidatus Poseidoniaceae archaeon]|nr:SAP domain-containing protein [Candidatus Poseidoniaceae archaeon]
KPLTGSAQVSAMDGLDSLTVVELKNRLRADGQKVSGAKKELILRLRGQESKTFLEFGEEEKNPASSQPGALSKKQVPCSYCRQILNVPEDYEGTIKCPVCKRSFHYGRGPDLDAHVYRKQMLQVTLVAFIVAFLAFLNGQRLGGISLFGGSNSGAFESFACGLVSGAVGCFTAFLAVVSWYSKPLNISKP